MTQRRPSWRSCAEAAMPETALPVFRIGATHGWRSLKLGEVWQARELLYFGDS